MSELLDVLKGKTRAKIHPMKIKGRFTRFRFWASWIMVLVLLALPWTTMNGDQTVLLDIPARKFILFGVTFWPSDVHLMIFILVGAAILLFFVTALAGRVWCGYACPQTVFLHAFYLPVEDWIEGGRAKRLARDQKGWTFDRFWRKALKHAIFIVASLIVGHSLVAYFLGAQPLIHALSSFDLSHRAAMTFALSASGLMYWDFAFFREQFCTYACPYARFQSALMDFDSLTVGYDPLRGEPRGKRRKDAAADLGDCVDCDKCVYVCPTGIDIRDGLQMECIQCARCIDACDTVMDALGKPRGLVRYGTEREFEQGKRSVIFMRPRVLIYSLLLLAIGGALTYRLVNRDIIEMTILRPPGAPFRVGQTGDINNQFTLKLLNKDRRDHALTFELEGFEGGNLVVPIKPFPVKAGEVGQIGIFVTAPQEALDNGRHKIRLLGKNEDGKVISRMEATFLGPRS
ncbi:MAG: cytochrome c oxidase accessory protein CcoG [Chrysiogenetes bacterium]|nr:cytochrome c oxidase accessory protein CcoG [Chrysiogenetes bacterium]